MDADDSGSSPIALEQVGFEPGEMIACAVCGRSSPPNRLTCIYCGTDFAPGAVDTARVKLSPRTLESWENGYNVVALPGIAIGDERIHAEVVRYTGIDADAIMSLSVRKLPLPVARVESEAAAEVVAGNLSRIGINTKVVRDSDIADGKALTRCRSVSFVDDGMQLTDFNSNKTFHLPNGSVLLIVAGSVREHRSEASEERKRRGPSKIEVQSESISETHMIDIYDDSHPKGFRLSSAGFDFSFLGASKEYVVSRNMMTLRHRIVEMFPGANFDDRYDDDRRFLDSVWELDEKTESIGKRRTSVTKSTTVSLTTRTNLRQFTAYSRLQRHLL